MVGFEYGCRCGLKISYPSQHGVLLKTEKDLATEKARKELSSTEKDFDLVCYMMDGWMTCDFTSFLTVFQSYQDDV